MGTQKTSNQVRNFFKTKQIWIGLTLASILATTYFFFRGVSDETFALKISAGSLYGRRNEIAEALKEEAEKANIFLEIQGTKGSGEALRLVSEGKLDLALIQGGIETLPSVQQVTVLQKEPLHVLVKPELREQGLLGLKDKRLNLSSRGSGTNLLSTEILRFAGLKSSDYEENNVSYSQIEKMSGDTLLEKLPDAFFTVSSLPSYQAEKLVREYGYVLMPIPFGAAFSNQRFAIQEYIIPPYTYGLDPAMPEVPLRTIGTQLLLVAHKDTPKSAVNKLLHVIYSGDFARKSNISSLDNENFLGALEYPAHQGAEMYRDRDNPAITSEFVEYVENFRSFVFSLIIASFFIWQWFARRKGIGFNKFLIELNNIEIKLLRIEMEADLKLDELKKIRNQLIHLKSGAINQFSKQGFSIRGEEVLTSFLNQATHTSSYISGLISQAKEKSKKDQQHKTKFYD